MADTVAKNGLIYTQDLHTVISVDSSGEFTGKVPYGAQEIAEDAFTGCNFESVSLPDSVKEIPPCLFENMTGLKSVKLPVSLKELQPYLFSGCKSLSSVKLPEVVTEYTEGLFYGCSSLEEAPFKAGIQILPENVFTGCEKFRSLVIPDTVTAIGPRAFADCKNLQSVVLSAKLYDLAEDAFEGCDNLRSIRIGGDNHLFYIGEEDGCLYEKSIDGDDKLRIRVAGRNQTVSLINEDFDDELPVADDSLFVLNDEEDENDNDLFTGNFFEESEISATDEEMNSVNENTVSEIAKVEGDENMENSDLDAMFADIMSDEKERTEVKTDVGVSADESKVLSEMMDVMADSAPQSNAGAVSQDELEKLFASHEAEVAEESSESAPNTDVIDSKSQILVDNVSFSKVIECQPNEDTRDDPELFVIAEKTITNEAGEEDFSTRLTNCAKKIASVQDMKRIIMVSGLPLDNDEFMQFFFHFMTKKNVILACEAANPSSLSDYCKTICEQSRISLEKKDLIEQRKSVSIKNNTLIKLVIQDIY